MRAVTLIAATSVCSAIAAMPAAACVTVEVENRSGHSVEIIWRAVGCGGVFDGHQEVCHHKASHAGDTTSFDFAWGDTGQVVIVRDSHKRYKGNHYTEWTYTYHDGEYTSSLFRGTPPHCKEHYKIRFTEEDWNSR